MTTSTQLRLRFPYLRKWVFSLSGSIKITLLVLLSFFTINTNAQIIINGQPGDWCTTLEGPNQTTKPHLHVSDPLNFGNDDTEFNQGTSDVLPLSEWHWGIGVVGDKTDLGNVALLIENNCNIYFMADRYAADGDADLGLWLFKDDVSLNPDGTFSGIHTDGDMLITSKYTNGGGTQFVRIYTWDGDNATGSLKLIYDSEEDTGLTAEQLKGVVNTTQLASCYPYQGKGNGFPANTYAIGTFFEGHIDLCALNALVGTDLEVDACFSNFIFKTSQSQEPTSSNGDLAFGNINSIPAEKELVGGSYCSSASGFNITLLDAATGVSYQLQKQNGAAWDNVGTAKSTTTAGSTIDFDGLQTAGTYRVIATTDGTNCTATFGNAVVTAITVNGGTGSGTQTVCSGGDPSVLSVTGASSGTGYTFKWQSNTTSCEGTFVDINGATGATYDPPANFTTTTYYRRVTTFTEGDVTCSANSTCITITVNNITGGTIAGGGTLCSPADPAAFTVTVAATGTATPTYQWQSKPGTCEAGGDWTNISTNGTGATYDVPAGLTATTSYRRVATSTVNSVACSANSNCITITISTTPSAPFLAVVNNCEASTITAYVSNGGALVPEGELTWSNGMTGNPIIVTTTTAVTATRTIGTCTSGASNSVTPAPIARPGAPTGTPASGCIGQEITLGASGCTGGTLYWYDAPTGGTSVGTGATFKTPELSESKTYYVSCKVGDCEGPRTAVTASVTACGAFCTYTQGAWGTKGGKMCDGTTGGYSTMGLLDQIFENWGTTGLIIGSNGNTVKITAAQCILDLLPGGGNSYALNGNITSCEGIKSNYAKLLPSGYKINNTLLAQTITLGLNLGINDNLASFSFADHSSDNKYLKTQALTSCGSTSVIPNSSTCDLIDPAVIALLKRTNWPASGDDDFPATVAGLYELANYALGGQSLAGTGVTLESIAGVVDAINNAFDECRAFVGFVPTDCDGSQTSRMATESSVAVTASPNPYSDRIRFVITSKVSGQGSLEVYNAMGQKIATPFQGYINAGRDQTVEYNVPASLRGNLFFKANVKDRFTSGKVVSLHK